MLRYSLTLLVAAGAAAAAPTARQIIEQIKSNVGVPWNNETVDTIKDGDPETPVTGIATTMMATFDVLRRASADGKNLVITHEPTFYSHQDKTDAFAEEHDAVWAEKDKFIRDHHMVVWRFHDHWHRRKPDGIMTGVLRTLGWQSYYDADTRTAKLPETTVGQLAAEVQAKLGAKTLRVVGNRAMKVTTVALQPGAGGPLGHRRALQRDEVEVLLIGEVPEWETVEYVNDAAAQGRHKALILVGHVASEQPGMEYCAEWLRTFIKGVPVAFVATPELVWGTEAGQSTNLSGTWTMDFGRSESAHQDVPIGPVTVVIKQTAADILIDTAQRASKNAAPTHEVIAYNFDGSDSGKANAGKSILSAKAHWDGETLVTETIRNIENFTVTTSYRHHLEASGRELVIEKSLTVQHGYEFQGSRTTGHGKDVFVKVQPK